MTTPAAPPSAWAFYGATGVTGRLVLARALAAGLRPCLVGRDAARLNALAAPHGLATAIATLDAPTALDAALAGCSALLNVAGPFVHTAPPLIEACLRTGTDYLDLSGELPSLRDLLAAQPRAAQAGIALVGGAGFGIAVTDCLARRLADTLGGVEHLRIAVAAASGHQSEAVAASTLAVIAGGGWEVAQGRLVRRRLARLRWHESLPDGGTLAFASAPLADLLGGLHAGAAREIVAGVPMPPALARLTALIAPMLARLVGIPAIGRRLARVGGHAATGSAAPLVSRAWIRGTRGERTLTLLLEGGEAFALAADIAVHAVRTHLAARPAPGAHTPATAYGAHWLDELPGLRITEKTFADVAATRRMPARRAPEPPVPTYRDGLR